MYKAAAVILLALLLSISLLGCRSDKEEVSLSFSQLVDSEANAESIFEASEFLDKNIVKLNEEDATSLITDYREYLLNYIIQNNDKTIIQELNVYIDEKTGFIDQEKISNSEHKSYYDLIKSSSLMVTRYEDHPTLKIDYNSLLSRYGNYISNPMKELYNFEAELINKPTSENAGLNISWKELLRRALIAENLIKEYPDERMLDDTMWIYTAHINNILVGATNTPIFDYATKKFSSSAKTAYQEFMHAEPNAVITWVLREYFSYLNSIDYTLDYNNCSENKKFFDMCDWLVSEAEKRVKE